MLPAMTLAKLEKTPETFRTRPKKSFLMGPGAFEKRHHPVVSCKPGSAVVTPKTIKITLKSQNQVFPTPTASQSHLHEILIHAATANVMTDCILSLRLKPSLHKRGTLTSLRCEVIICHTLFSIISNTHDKTCLLWLLARGCPMSHGLDRPTPVLLSEHIIPHIYYGIRA